MYEEENVFLNGLKIDETQKVTFINATSAKKIKRTKYRYCQ